MSNLATIGGFTQVAQAIVAIELNGSGFPLDPVTGVPSTNNTVNIAGVNTPVQAVALYTVDSGGNNPVPGSGGNATVPPDAPIQPPQAFVDNVEQWFTSLSNSDGTLNLANKGITFINPGTTTDEFGVFAFCQGVSAFGSPVMDFRGNAIPSSNVNAILAACVAQGVPGGILQLEGGTNGAPTGQGIVDKATLITVNSWTVTTN